MHRFRKKSETRRSGQVPSSDSEETSPQIPLPSDFRTSLILPDLSRRFSLLRSSSGEPVALDVLRSRLADQRARGAANHISEEEEEMIFDTLRNFRSKPSASAQQSAESVNATDTDDFRHFKTSTIQSSPSSTPSSASITSSPTGRGAKRYSNNLFGSGRFNDYNYLRSVAKNGSTRTQSLTPTESSYRGNTSSVVDSLRPVTPDSSGFSPSTQSSPNLNENTPSVRSAPLAAPAPFGEQAVSVAEYRISKTLGPSVLKRASMAIEEVIKEFEEETEDEILMPRSTPIPRGNVETPSSDPVRNSTLSQSSIFEAVMAISSDKHVQSDPEVIDRRASPVPSRILPGYVPGMPRPMTPRDFDIEEQRSLSITPRAASPMAASFTDTSIPNISATSRLRSNSTASQSGGRSPTSPLFLQRSPSNGRYTPEDSTRANSTDFESPLNSSLLAARRRPASPLTSPPFQPMAVSSRPSTPSNIVWNTNISQSPSGHSRNESWASDGAISSSDVHGAHDHYTSGPRPLRSPPLPDSPIEGGSLNLNTLGSVSYDSAITLSDTSTMTLAELGSPSRAQRSVTPTQSAIRSPTSSTLPNFRTSVDSKRSSTQNPPPNSIPPLVFSPLINSSRSSLESTGSSYHTWDAEEKDRSLALFSDPDTLQPVWHDLSSSSSATPGDSPDDNWNPEEIVARIAGLKKSDFVVIQEKLLTARDAKERENKQEPQERAASSLRKRRPSTSQSNYSSTGREPRIASPPPTSPSKATSVPPTRVDRPPSALDTAVSSPVSVRDKDISPTSRRNRDLAQALFGREEVEIGKSLKPESIGQTFSSDQSLKSPAANLDAHSSSSTLSPSFASPYQLHRNPSVPRIPQTPQEEAQLTREVQERINAATEFLKPSNGSHSPDPNATISRKRINPSQISTPRLVASTSVVGTVPIVKAPSVSSTNNSGPSKIGSRFKKLRGTLRAKNPLPNGDEITPYSLDLHSPPPVQIAHYDSATLKVPGPPASAVDSRFRVPVPSPPASAGPSLKGFMARFRGKQRPAVDTSAEPEHRMSPQPSPQLPSQQASSLPAASGNERTFSQPVLSPLGRKPVPISRPETPQAHSAPPTQEAYGDSAPAEPTESSDMKALRQLFEAANRIGIDQGELNALLARSGSTSSKTDWTALTRSNSAVRPGAATLTDPSRLTPSLGRPSIDDQSMRALTPDPKVPNHGTGRPSMDSQARDKPVSRQVSRKQADHTRRTREGKGSDNNVVVRKTIIFPDTNMTTDELERFMKKSLPGRRASVTSVSSRSIHDRAPTPPPPRSPTHKRFSNGPSPPVPSLPAALGNLTAPTTSAGGPIEKSNSTYDSLYDMYAGESRSPSATPNESGPSRPHDDLGLAPESQAAVELIHLANGETIWNIVNGLREDDDDESVYTRRTSFASEYYPRGTHGDSGIQIIVKGHERSGSKGSASSVFKRSQGKARPETKVFHSPAEDIGRLIQDLSRNMEAGSFNFAPRPGHSASSSLSTNDMTWTLEERLDEMIDTVRAK